VEERVTPDRLAAVLDLLHWSARDLAAEVALNERTVRRWLSGEYEVPAPIGAWLEDLAVYHVAHPAPRK
jgi:hypothetical protein